MDFGDGCRLDALHWDVAEVALDGGYKETPSDEHVYFEDSYAGARSRQPIIQAVALFDCTWNPLSLDPRCLEVNLRNFLQEIGRLRHSNKSEL